MLVTFLVSTREDDSTSFSQPSLAREQASGKFLSDPNEISGSQTGSQRSQMLGHRRRRTQTINPASWRFTRQKATAPDASVAPYKRRVTGSNPVAPTVFSNSCLQKSGKSDILLTLNAWTKNCRDMPAGCAASCLRRGSSSMWTTTTGAAR